MKYFFLITFITAIAAAKSFAQQMPGMKMNDTATHHTIDKKKHKMVMPEKNHADSTSVNGMKHSNDTMQMNMPAMSNSFSLNLPMNRDGSGTSWLPDASPVNAYMFHSKKWMFMLHGNQFLRYTNQDFSNKGVRGGDKLDGPDWIMLMGQRLVNKNNLFHFSIMLSADPLIESGYGYPLLFQSGESWKGKSLVDRQHPHDLFSELALSWSHSFNKKTDVFLYAGYPGEPALGPVTFMHRPSSQFNPDAPVSHHWIDATHITFGVATLGFRSGKFKLEGSSFTGREPDENRYNFDKPRFDSWSGRLSFNPDKNWALQVSQGFIKNPEELHPGEDVTRTTASALYSVPLGNNNSFDAAAVWGMNKSKGSNAEHAILLEGSWQMNKIVLHARYEFVQKSAEELLLDENIYGKQSVFPVNAFTLGFNYHIFKIGQINFSFGSQLSMYHADEKLNSLYGENPMAYEIYFRIYPGFMKM